MPSLAALRAFECVARHLSFARAADELCVTPPSLSHHVKALEAELGCRLFIRAHRSIALTEAGRTLSEATTRAFADLGAAWDGLATAPRPFRITCGVHFMTNWLAPRAARLRDALDGYDVDPIATFEKLDVAAGEVDLAIRNGDEVVAGLHCETVYPEWWAPMVAPGLASRLRHPADLLAVPAIESRHPREPRGHPSAADWLRAAGVAAAHGDVRHVSHTETAMQMAAEGRGFKLCQSVQASELYRQKRLVIPFQLAIRREGLRFYMVCRTGEEASPLVAAVRAFLAAEFEAMDLALGLDGMEVVRLPALGVPLRR